MLAQNNPIAHFGRYMLMLRQIFTRPDRMSMFWKETFRQMNDIGVGSVLIVAIIAIFIGAVSTVQFSYQLAGSSIPIWYVSYIVRDSLIIELAPTFSCMALAGKVGSNITAEIGGMRQKEQVDALEIMGVNTAAYLITPRILASVIVTPMLVVLATYTGIIGGYLASQAGHLLTSAEFKQGLLSFYYPYNVTMMLVKAFVFAFILSSIACYQGYYVKGGSIELGKASTRTVVLSNIFILLSDYIIALIMT